MAAISIGGYVGKMLRVDLTTGRFTEWSLDEQTLREYIRGVPWGKDFI